MNEVREPGVQPVGILIGEPVANPAGEDLGHIEEIMIDVHDGMIAYAIVSSKDPSEKSERLVAIPWRSLRHDPESARFILDSDRVRLAGAPGFERGHWPKMADRSWGERVHQFYGQVPYWQQAYFGEHSAAPTQGGGEKKPSPFH